MSPHSNHLSRVNRKPGTAPKTSSRGDEDGMIPVEIINSIGIRERTAICIYICMVWYGMVWYVMLSYVMLCSVMVCYVYMYLCMNMYMYTYIYIWRWSTINITGGFTRFQRADTRCFVKPWMDIWGVFINGGTPIARWLVDFMENPSMDENWG